METNTQTGEKISLTLTPNRKYIAETLGIEDTRRDELCGIIEENAEGDEFDISERMAIVASSTTNHNELAFTMFIFGCFMADRQNSQNPLAALAAALGGAITDNDLEDDGN